MRSLSSNVVGVLIASASLYAAHLLGGSLLAVGTGSAITVTTVSHPGLVAATACVLGASFGLLSEYVAKVLTRAPAGEPSGEPTAEGSPA